MSELVFELSRKEAIIRSLLIERDDYKDDSLRLHKDKCDALDCIRELKAELASLRGAHERLRAAQKKASWLLDQQVASSSSRKTMWDVIKLVRAALQVEETP